MPARSDGQCPGLANRHWLCDHHGLHSAWNLLAEQLGQRRCLAFATRPDTGPVRIAPIVVAPTALKSSRHGGVSFLRTKAEPNKVLPCNLKPEEI